jgi:hypothetical protein
LVANFDGSPDGCVGSGDFGGFAGCYAKACADCANCFPSLPAAKPEEEYSLVQEVQPAVFLELAAVKTPTSADAAAVLPDSDESFVVGDTFFLEVWARSGRESDKVAAAYVDVFVDPLHLTIENVIPSKRFGLFAGGSFIRHVGQVESVGGCIPLDRSPESIGTPWVRVSTLALRARRAGRTDVFFGRESTDALGVALLGRLGDLDRTQVACGKCSIDVLGRKNRARRR